MNPSYTANFDCAVTALVTLLRDLFAGNLRNHPEDLDRIIQQLGRLVLPRVFEEVVKAESERLLQALAEEGYKIERSPTVTWKTMHGPVQVRSPYLVKAGARGRRPVNEHFGMRGGGSTRGLQRVTSDFGLDTSFEVAAEKVREHYGIDIHRTAIRRNTLKHGRGVREQDKFDGMDARYIVPAGPAPTDMLLEMDGSCVRTGQLVPANTPELTPKRNLPKRQRVTEWRDLRLCFVQWLGADGRLFVGGIEDFDAVVDRLLVKALELGWTGATPVLRLTDGGGGLREELDRRFPCGQHVLDKFHMVQQLYEAGKEMYRSKEELESAVVTWTRRISAGEADAVIAELRAHEGPGAARAARLGNYLHRFRDAMNYDALEAANRPIGSGAIESGHKSEVQCRFKLPGCWWDLRNANDLLAFRLLRSNGGWDDYWEAA